MRVIIVHGEKQNPDGAMHEEYLDRLKVACAFITLGDTLLILTGGKTRAGYPAEAEQAKEWCLANGISEDVVRLEMDSRTTNENIIFAKRLLKKERVTPTQVVVIARKSAMPKTRYLYGRLWRMERTIEFQFIATKDTKSVWYRIADRTILYLAAIVDPRDTWILAIPKRLFRNSSGI